MSRIKSLAVISALAFHLAAIAAPTDIAQVPLTTMTTVEPNIMLLVDNSLSMDNIVTADSYVPTIDYPSWGWASTASNLNLTSIDTNTSCGTNGQQVKGTKGATTKYLCLPKTVGGGTNTYYSGNYLNYLFETYASNTDLTTGTIPRDARIKVAKDVSTDIVNTVTGVRFGLSTFDSGNDGASINAECGSTTTTLTTAIAAVTSKTYTPLAEAYYDVTRYFRGLASNYSNFTAKTSPILYRCQKNFSIIVTDGLPTYDDKFPTDDPADVADTTRSLPNWDGLSPTTDVADFPVFPQYSDGHGSNTQIEGKTLYLDDIAKFAYDIDFRTSGNDNAGGSYSDPKFLKQNMETYTVGFSVANQMLEDAAGYGHGQYYTANTAVQLKSSLVAALADMGAKTSSSSSIASNSTRLDTNTFIYQAKYDTAGWVGYLYAFKIDPTTGAVAAVPSWDAGTLIPSAASRNIVTWRPDSGVGTSFLWANLSATQQTALGSADVLDYIRGSAAQEKKNGGAYRDRSRLMGDIVNSDPWYVGQQNFGYTVLPEPEGTDYLTFISSAAVKNRTPMVYIGANDGMLHGVNANTGAEKFTYIPDNVIPNLKKLADPAYAHQYFVDGAPRAADAYLDTASGKAWKTVLVGSTGAGGRAIYALDVTTPDSFSASNVLWEFSHTELGVTIGQPTVVRTPGATGKWVAIFGNGYNSTSGTARLFVVDASTGALIAAIDTKSGDTTNPNGLSTPVAVDSDGDRMADLVYAGDLRGNMWRFDIADIDPNKWTVAYGTKPSPAPLFKAVGPDGLAQPITAKPAVGLDSKGGILVYFGTGKYIATADNTVVSPAPVQSLYGIQDNGSTVARSDLLKQEMIYENTLSFDGYFSDVRIVSQNDRTTQKGWYIDLVSVAPANKGKEGERVVTVPLVWSDRVIFVTMITSSDPCLYGGSSWIMEVDPSTGGRLDYSVFDLNHDALFNSKEYVTVVIDGKSVQVPVSGKRTDEGIAKTPGVISAGDTSYKYTSGSTGKVEVTANGAGKGKGRQSWQQLR